jgi:hypothetical protein
MALDLSFTISPELDNIMAAQLIAMKKEHNGLSPLCRIPPEVMSRILLHTQHPASTLNSDGNVGSDESECHVCNQEDRALLDLQWETVMLVCTRMYETSISTPELWAYVSTRWPLSRTKRYLSRAGQVPLAVHWAVVHNYTDGGGGLSYTTDMAISRIIVQRSRVIHLNMSDIPPAELKLLLRFDDQPAPHLSTLHVNLAYANESFLQLLKTCTTLTDISVANCTITDELLANVRLPLLTRLHLSDVDIDASLRGLIALLRTTLLLEELVLTAVSIIEQEDDDDDTEGGHVDDADADEDTLEIRHEALERSLYLPSLRKLVLFAWPHIICTLLRVVSLDVFLLQKLKVNPHGYFGKRMPSSALDKMLQEVAVRLNTAGILVPHGKWIWAPSLQEESMSIIFSSSGDATLSFHLQLVYYDDHAPVYRRHNIAIDTIEVEDLTPDVFSSWKLELDKIMDVYCSGGVKLMTFMHCNSGVPGLESWVRAQHKAGQIISRVKFWGWNNTCGKHGGTWTDYKALESSGLVQHVEWFVEDIN